MKNAHIADVASMLVFVGPTHHLGGGLPPGHEWPLPTRAAAIAQAGSGFRDLLRHGIAVEICMVFPIPILAEEL